jgi:hypothetical protein
VNLQTEINSSPLKLPQVFCYGDKEVSNTYRGKIPRITDSTLENKVRELTLPNHKNYYKAAVTKTMLLVNEQRNRSMKQNKSTEVGPHKYSQLLLTKGQRQYDGTKIVFSKYGAGTTDIYRQKINLNTDHTPITKINSKWFTDLNVKCKLTKLLEHNITQNLDDLVYGDEFLLDY